MKDAVVRFASGGGVAKCRMSLGRMFLLAMLAGFFLAVGAFTATIGSCMVENGSVARILSGLLFSAGLCFVIANGAELFTGNNLIIISVLDKKVDAMEMLRNWVIVYLGNFAGSVLFCAIAVYGNTFSLFDGAAGTAMLSTAVAKCSIAFVPGLLKGIICNFLVCTAVMMALSTDTITGKFMCASIPVMLFVICGFEHSIANMSYVAAGIFLKNTGLVVDGMEAVTWVNLIIKNLIPVTIGNIIGGAGLGTLYWFANIKRTD